MKSKFNRGQSLIEVAVAVGVIAMATVVMVNSVSRAMANNRLSKERIIATRLAQEGWEWLQRQTGDDWNGMYNQVEADASGTDATYCLGDLDAFNIAITGSNKIAPGACTGGFDLAQTNYSRQVVLIPYDSGADLSTPIEHIKAVVEVSWNSRGRVQYATVSGTLNE